MSTKRYLIGNLQIQKLCLFKVRLYFKGGSLVCSSSRMADGAGGTDRGGGRGGGGRGGSGNGTTRPDRGGGGDRGGGNVQNEGGRGARGSKGQSQRCGRPPVCLFENPLLGTDVCKSFAGVIVCRVPASLLLAPPWASCSGPIAL